MVNICIPINKETFGRDQSLLISEHIYWNSDYYKKGVMKNSGYIGYDLCFVINGAVLYTCDKNSTHELIESGAIYYNSVKLFLRTRKLERFLK